MNASSKDNRWQVCLVIVAVLCGAGTWVYGKRVLTPAIVEQAAKKGIPLGHNSDLFPRWWGSRELLLHGRDPYQMEVTREIQIGMIGRPYPPDDYGNGHNYQQGFYYPVYVAFLLAPTLDLPFPSVQRGFWWVLVASALLMVLLWLRLLQWKIALWKQAVVIIFTMGSLPLMQALALRQMTVMVAAIITVALGLLTVDQQVVGGVLLAVATIKPQSVWLLLLWLMIWTLGDWRRRYRWLASFLVTMAVLCAASEYYLPHWIARFLQALREYRAYTGEKSVVQMLVGRWGIGLEFLAIALMAAVFWKQRRAPAKSLSFSVTASFALAISVLVVPSYHPYNQALMLPAVMIMVKERRQIWQRGVSNRVLGLITAVLLGWPWLSSIVLAALSFLLPVYIVERGAMIPIWTELEIPIGIAAVMLVYGWQQTFAPSPGPSPS